MSPSGSRCAGCSPSRLLAVVLFVLTFKLGDLALQPMLRPFWVDAATRGKIGYRAVHGGTGATIVGALVGGVAHARLGDLPRALDARARAGALEPGLLGRRGGGAPAAAHYGAAIVEQFTSGLGTAAFLTFLMALSTDATRPPSTRSSSRSTASGGVVAGADLGRRCRARMGYAPYFLLDLRPGAAGVRALPPIRRVPLDEERGAMNE